MTVLESLAALDDIKRTHDTVVVAHLKLEDETTRESFTAVATDLRDNFVFCTMNDSSDAAGEGTEVPSVVLYKKMAETRSILRNPLDAGAIRDFVKTAAQPLIMPLLPELHGQIMQVKFLRCRTPHTWFEGREARELTFSSKPCH